MRGWLHFIDKADYHVKKFLRVVADEGIALTVSLATLKDMQWGDAICLLQEGGDPSIKSTVFFAEFPLDRITGLSAKAVDVVTGEFRSALYDMGGDKIIRAGREVHTGFAYKIDAALGAIAEALVGIAGEVEIGVPMLTCSPERISEIGRPLPMLRDLKYRTGYRAFDYGGLAARMIKQRQLFPKKRPDLGGQWEPAPSNEEAIEPEACGGDVESVVLLPIP